MSQNYGTGIRKKKKKWSLNFEAEKTGSSEFFWGFGENLYNGSRHFVMKIEPKNQQ